MKDKIQQELENNKLFAVQYGFLITALVVIVSVAVLYYLNIEGEPVIYWVYKNYIK